MRQTYTRVSKPVVDWSPGSVNPQTQNAPKPLNSLVDAPHSHRHAYLGSGKRVTEASLLVLAAITLQSLNATYLVLSCTFMYFQCSPCFVCP